MSAETLPAYLAASLGTAAVVRRAAGTKGEAGAAVAVGTRGTVDGYETDARGRRIAVLATDAGAVRVLARRVDLA